MDNDTREAQDEPVNDTQDEPMPSSNQKTEAQADENEETQDTSSLPDSVKERTRSQFEKLQAQLREERTRREYYESVLAQNTQPKKDDSVPVYDPNTGLINEQALTETQRRAFEAEKKATDAEKRLNSFIEDMENRETYAVHPELNPDSDKFDKNLHIATRRILTDAMLNPADYGKTLSFREAGDLAKAAIAKSMDQARKEGAQAAIEQLTPKEQAALDAVGTPGRRSQAGSRLEELQSRTRRGDITATIERMRRLESSQE